MERIMIKVVVVAPELFGLVDEDDELYQQGENETEEQEDDEQDDDNKDKETNDESNEILDEKNKQKDKQEKIIENPFAIHPLLTHPLLRRRRVKQALDTISNILKRTGNKGNDSLLQVGNINELIDDEDEDDIYFIKKDTGVQNEKQRNASPPSNKSFSNIHQLNTLTNQQQQQSTSLSQQFYLLPKRYINSTTFAYPYNSIGIATLDPEDWQYRPHYDQSDNDDFTTACGFSYHQGPEWVWVAGFFIRALIIHKHIPNSQFSFDDEEEKIKIREKIKIQEFQKQKEIQKDLDRERERERGIRTIERNAGIMTCPPKLNNLDSPIRQQTFSPLNSFLQASSLIQTPYNSQLDNNTDINSINQQSVYDQQLPLSAPIQALVHALNQIAFFSVRNELDKNPWLSLPELTNVDGGFCPGSSSAQAWSASCMLDAIHDLTLLAKEEEIRRRKRLRY